MSSPINRKILGFDSWTEGSHHYVRLLSAFKEQRMDLSLLHLSTWSDAQLESNSEVINGLPVRDISFYHGKTFDEIIKLEKPDAVILLSTETFLHRAFLRYCRINQVPSVHLYHGIHGVFPVGDGDFYNTSVVGHVRYIFKRLRKSLGKAVPIYTKSLWKTDASFREWVRFFKDIVFLGLGKWPLLAAQDARTDKICVYTDSEAALARVRFDCDENVVAAVGNPDLLYFDLKQHELLSGFTSNSSTREVIYIETGISSFGLNFKDDEDYLNFLIRGKHILDKHGLDLVVKLKPHPNYRYQRLTADLKKNKIKLVEKDELVARLKVCVGCITETSTLGVLPELLGKRLGLIKVGALSTLRYGEIFTSYPLAKEFFEWDDFATWVVKDEIFDPSVLLDWVLEHAGPLPAVDFPKRVANIVSSLLS